MKKVLLFSFLFSIITAFSFAVYFNVGKAETLEECIKRYQAQNISYDNAKLKCSNLQTPAASQITPITQPAKYPVQDQTKTQTQTQTGDACVDKYMNYYNLTAEQAKLKCYPSVAPTQNTTQVPTGSSVDDCIKKYMSQTGNTYEDAKEKCTPITPKYVQPVVPKEGVTPLEGCVQKYLNSNYSSEEAKKICSQQIPTTTTATETSQQTAPVESCIKKYMEVFNISYADAKAKCTNVPQPTATAIQVIEKRSDCADLENQLTQLTQKIQSAQGQETDKIMAEIKKIKQAFMSCQAPVSSDPCVQARKNIYESEQKLQQGVTATETSKIKAIIEENNKKLANCGQAQATPAVKNPCDEIAELTSTYEAMLKKEVQIKDLISQGQMDKTNLEDLGRQMEFLKKKLEQMQLACQQGNKTVDESPCSRLTKLQMIYSQNQDQNLVKEITSLKERCLSQDLSSEKAGTLADAEEIYKSKLMTVVEGTFGQKQVDNLKQTENQKDKLVNEVVKNSSEFDMRGITIVDKVNIGKGKISLDNIQAPSVPVKIDMNGKEITIDSSKSEITQIDDDVSWVVKIDDDVTWLTKEGKLIGTNSGKPITILPSEIKDKVGAQPSNIAIQDNVKPEYVVRVDTKAKLFGFIPVSTSRNYLVDAETGVSQETKPWWDFVLKY